MGDPSFNGFAYMFGGVSVVLQAVYQTLVQQCGENKLSPLHVLHLNSCISLVPFVILTFGKGELKAVLTYQYIGGKLFYIKCDYFAASKYTAFMIVQGLVIYLF